jgi:hypothetical protein
VLNNFCDWLSRTRVSVTFQSWDWFVPLVQTVHILCIAVVTISLCILSFCMMGLSRGPQSLAAMTGKSLPWTWGALGVLLFTGALLTITEPARELLSNVFRAKMVMVLILVGVLLLIQTGLRENPSYWTGSPRRRLAAHSLGISLLLLGVCIVTAGRWIAYV